MCVTAIKAHAVACDDASIRLSRGHAFAEQHAGASAAATEGKPDEKRSEKLGGDECLVYICDPFATAIMKSKVPWRGRSLDLSICFVPQTGRIGVRRRVKGRGRGGE